MTRYRLTLQPRLRELLPGEFADERRVLEGNGDAKLYPTPSDGKTVGELSGSVGTTTRRVVTRSRAVKRNPFKGHPTSERTEEAPLVSEDEARRMPLDDAILVIDAQMPIQAKRIEYFRDREFKKLYDGQSGPIPLPEELDVSVEPARDMAPTVEQANNRRSEADPKRTIGPKRRGRKSPDVDQIALQLTGGSAEVFLDRSKVPSDEKAVERSIDSLESFPASDPRSETDLVEDNAADRGGKYGGSGIKSAE